MFKTSFKINEDSPVRLVELHNEYLDEYSDHNNLEGSVWQYGGEQRKILPKASNMIVDRANPTVRPMKKPIDFETMEVD